MNKVKKKRNSIENLRKVLNIFFFNQPSATISIIKNILKDNFISTSTIYRKLEELRNKDIIIKETGRPNIYVLNPTIDTLILELNRLKRTNLSDLKENLGLSLPKLIEIIRYLEFHKIINGEIIPEDSNIIFLNSK